MEMVQFDALTRQWDADGGSRRRLMRALAVGLCGSALGGGVAAFARAEAAARKKRGARQPARHGQVDDEKQHRKKKRHKKAKGTQACGEGERRCHDGRCASQGSCCPDERACEDGSCLSVESCCPEAAQPTCGDCQAAVCEDGELVCRSTCEEGVVCCNGGCAGRCTGGMAINPATCQCECPSGTELMADSMTCCPIPRACGRKGNAARLATVCCAESDHCCDDFDICVDAGSACE